jgi:hypothetical protein
MCSQEISVTLAAPSFISELEAQTTKMYTLMFLLHLNLFVEVTYSRKIPSQATMVACTHLEELFDLSALIVMKLLQTGSTESLLQLELLG